MDKRCFKKNITDTYSALHYGWFCRLNLVLVISIMQIILFLCYDKIGRAPRGSAIPRPEVYAGCRACCEGSQGLVKVNIFVDV